MKKILLTLSAGLLVFALGLSAQADQNTAMKSGCLGCHKADAKLVGPSFQDIAAKYSDQDGIVDTLAATVKSGSAGGNWGKVPMPASPAPVDDIKTVIAWMLSHK